MENNTTPKKYQPSNGTEGMEFTDKFCMRCIHCNPDSDGDKQCEILLATIIYDYNEPPAYPEEWIYDEDDKPTCTKWEEWNWEENGDPDDPLNPNAPIPFNPNQLTIF